MIQIPVFDPKEPDHRNLDRLDNRKANLRVGTRALNNQNRKSHIGATSTLRGVSWNKARSKWQAQGCVGGVNKYLGLYEDEDEAGRVAAEWREKNLEFAVEILR